MLGYFNKKLNNKLFSLHIIRYIMNTLTLNVCIHIEWLSLDKTDYIFLDVDNNIFSNIVHYIKKSFSLL